MKILLFLILLFTWAPAFAANDKVLHFGAGAIISTATYLAVKKKHPRHAMTAAILAGIAAGIAKEIYDPRFDSVDALATTGGAFVAGFIWEF